MVGKLKAVLCSFTSWALRVSNPRPSPCKGEKDAQVRALTCRIAVPWSTAEYLGVPSACYAGVMRSPLISSTFHERCRKEGLVEGVDGSSDHQSQDQEGDRSFQPHDLALAIIRPAVRRPTAPRCSATGTRRSPSNRPWRPVPPGRRPSVAVAHLLCFALAVAFGPPPSLERPTV
jgi:hypothetical protein